VLLVPAQPLLDEVEKEAHEAARRLEAAAAVVDQLAEDYEDDYEHWHFP